MAPSALAMPQRRDKIERMLIKALLLSLLAMSPPDPANEPNAEKASMECNVGPVTRSFGGTEWTVFSCDDEASMIAISAKGNPALPFIFVMKEEDGNYKITGEGNGDRSASQAAGDEIARMTNQEFSELLAATKGVEARPVG